MPILSYGIYKPSLKDQADVVFPAMEANWQQVNDHNHDGVNSVLISANTLLPSQAGNAGKVLTTNGTNVSWVVPPTAVPELPDQTGNNGKILSTDGSSPLWIDAPTEIPDQTGNTGKFLTTDGSVLSWATITIPPDELPSQIGEDGKFLTTAAGSPLWAAISQVPDVSGANPNDILTTDGVTYFWAAPPAAPPDELPDQTGNGGKLLTTDGSVVSWTGSVADLELTGNPILNNTFISSYSNGGAGNTISLFSSQGTFAAPTASLAGDSLLFLGGRGHDGTSYNAGSKAAITINTSENHTPTANGTQITFATTENGTTSRKNRVRVENTGAITFFGNTSGSISLKPAAVTTTHTWNLPAANAAGVLTNDGSGNLSWAAAGGGGLPPFSQHFNSGAFAPTTTTTNTWGAAPTVATLTMTGSFSIGDEVIIKLNTLLTLVSPSGTGVRGGTLAIFDHNNNLIWASSGRWNSLTSVGDLEIYPMSAEKRFTFTDAPVNPAFTVKIRQTDAGTEVSCGQTTTGSGGEITHEFWAFRNN